MTIRLVPFGDEHVAPFAKTIEDPDVLRFTGVPVPTPAGWIDSWRAAYAEHDDRDSFAIVDDAEATHAGFVGWAVGFGRDRDAAQIELGYALSPWARGRGLATEALRLLSRWALADGMLRLVLQIQETNHASQAVARRAGYTYEGTQRSVHHKNGERVDLELWSLLPGDLPAEPAG
jgi:RimJ/RimL family protein N-acetyltransferase